MKDDDDRFIQADHKVRIVALSNLAAMCKRISGMCHRYTFDADRVTRYARVEYSNPDEYGHERPLTALYPVIRDHFGKDLHGVILATPHRVIGKTDSEDWQKFEILRDCPILWRDPQTKKWRSEAEIAKELVAKVPQ